MAPPDRITRDPDVMDGKPCIRGMRVTVDTVLGLLAAGRAEEEILDAYPYLEPEDIEAVRLWESSQPQEGPSVDELVRVKRRR